MGLGSCRVPSDSWRHSVPGTCCGLRVVVPRRHCYNNISSTVYAKDSQVEPFVGEGVSVTVMDIRQFDCLVHELAFVVIWSSAFVYVLKLGNVERGQ